MIINLKYSIKSYFGNLAKIVRRTNGRAIRGLRQQLHFILCKCDRIVDRWKETLFGHVLVKAALLQRITHGTFEGGKQDLEILFKKIHVCVFCKPHLNLNAVQFAGDLTQCRNAADIDIIETGAIDYDEFR